MDEYADSVVAAMDAAKIERARGRRSLNGRLHRVRDVAASSQADERLFLADTRAEADSEETRDKRCGWPSSSASTATEALLKMPPQCAAQGVNRTGIRS